MKKVSRWAKHHIVPARIIIVFSFITLTLLGILTGTLLSGMDIYLPAALMMGMVTIYLTGLIAYPAKSLKGKKMTAAAFYIRQKSCDLLLAASTFCMIVYFSNQPGQLLRYSTSLNAAIPTHTSFPKDSTVKIHKPIAAFAASLKDETGKKLKWKERRKLLKEQVKSIKKSDLSRGAKIALIILSVFVAAGLLALILALSCELSCSGAEGAAVLVGVGGVILIGLLLVLVIRGILGKKRKKKRDIAPDDPGQ
jgi:hypothetical protein